MATGASWIVYSALLSISLPTAHAAGIDGTIVIKT
jgi:hypothetical protein